MKLLIWLLRALVAAVLLWLAAKNSQLVTLHGLFDQQWQAPLALVLLIAFVAGAFLGLLAAFTSRLRLRRGSPFPDRPVAPAAASTGEPPRPLTLPHGN